MDWLNYHHLRYFWATAHEGSITAAAERLRLSRATVTSQIRELESALGQALFRKQGRNLAITEFGQQVLLYADEIFATGEQIQNLSLGIHAGRQRVVVGIPDVMPKLIAYRLLVPVLQSSPPVLLECREGNLEQLLAEMALHRVDLVLSDSPTPANAQVRAFHHKLGECGISICGSPPLAKRFRKGFPDSLAAAPMLMPAEKTSLRRNLNYWMARSECRPDIVAEFDDSALLKIFGQSGVGLFPVASAVVIDAEKRYAVEAIGELPEVKEEFYLISLEKSLKDPVLLSILACARNELFA